MTVCYFGAYDPSYARNRILMAGLKAHGIRVIECHSRKPRLIRLVSLIWQYLRWGWCCDVLVVGAFGHAYVPLAWVLARMSGKPLIFDAFASLYEVQVIDRRL